MASSLSRRFSTKLLKPSLSTSPFSHIFADRFTSQNPNPNSSISLLCFQPSSEENPANPVSGLFLLNSSDSATSHRFPALPTVGCINPNLKFVRSLSTAPTGSSCQSLAIEKPTDANPNFSKPNLDFSQTPPEGKSKNHFHSFFRTDSKTSAAAFRLQKLPLEKPSNPRPSFFRSFASSAQTPPEEITNYPDANTTSSSSTSGNESESPESKHHGEHPGFQHQEIVGPTVERDVSALGEETRQVLMNLRKTILNLSRVVALLGVVQLSCGAWIVYTTKSSPFSEISIQSFVAFAFPFSLAFLLRQTLKPMSFFQKMEEQGRLQILTLALQVSKCLNLFFLRVRVISFLCVVGMSMGLLFTTTWSG